MKTLIELYDERPLDNVLATEMFKPEETVYICPPEVAKDKALTSIMRRYFKLRGCSTRLTFEPVSMLDEGNVKSVVINTDTVDITPKADQNSQMIVKYYTTRTEDITALTERLDKANVTFSRKETSVALEIVETVPEVEAEPETAAPEPEAEPEPEPEPEEAIEPEP